MTIAVTHSTVADDSFSATGAAAWDANHTLSGVGTMAEQNANNVAITGGTISGITDLAVADGGTGASTAATARVNILPSYTGNANKRLTVNAGATDVEWVDDGGGTVTSVTGTAPVVSSGGTTPAISMAQATGSVNGYLSSTDWTTFNNKQNAFGSQTANYVYAAPNGSAGSPTFRALVSADIPSLSSTYIPYTGASSAIDLNTQTVVNIDHLGIGTTSVPTILLRAIGDNNSTSRIAVRGYSSNANSSAIRVTKFRGTVAAPQAPQSGDSLGKFELAGYGTTSSDGYPQASFEGVATETWGAIARGAKTVIKVTPNTTTTQVVAVTFDQDKSATFAGALSVTGTTTLATSLSGLAKLTSGVVSTATSGTDYAPATSGTSILYGNGSGGFSNVTIGTGVSFAGGTLSATGSGGTVTSVSGTAPIASSGGATPAISISQATTSTDGYLSSTDWNTFNNKQPAGSYLTTVTASTPLSGSGTVGSPLVIAQATTSTSGYLSSTDWNTFNGKGSGTVTSVGGTGSVNGITLTGTVTSTGSLTLGGTLDLSAPPAIGGTTPNTGKFTTLTATSGISGGAF
jgi:hypothetical protein